MSGNGPPGAGGAPDLVAEYRRDGRLLRLARSVSHRVTRSIATRWGHRFPMFYVAEYPRSGGTWLAHMLADYLGLPFPKHSVLPIGFASVLHTHLAYSQKLPKSVFVMRDGRDIVVSSYFHALRTVLDKPDSAAAAVLLRRFPALQGADGTRQDCRDRLPNYIPQWASGSPGCKTNWAQYCRPWLTDRNRVAVTSYEQLRTTPVDELTRIVQHLLNSDVDRGRVEESVIRFSFERQTGRHPGQADLRSAKRNGLVGDWKNYFTRDAAKTFDKLCGDFLVQAGYETDRNWWHCM